MGHLFKGRPPLYRLQTESDKTLGSHDNETDEEDSGTGTAQLGRTQVYFASCCCTVILSHCLKPDNANYLQLGGLGSGMQAAISQLREELATARKQSEEAEAAPTQLQIQLTQSEGRLEGQLTAKTQAEEAGRQARQQLLAKQLEAVQLQNRLTQSEGRPEGYLTAKAQAKEAGRQALEELLARQQEVSQLKTQLDTAQKQLQVVPAQPDLAAIQHQAAGHLEAKQMADERL